MTLTTKKQKELKSLAHHLKAVILVGSQGLTKNVFAAMHNAMETKNYSNVTVMSKDNQSTELDVSFLRALVKDYEKDQAGEKSAINWTGPKAPYLGKY